MTYEEYLDYNLSNLERIYECALFAPIFRFNERFPDCKIPFINYNDIMDYKYIMREKDSLNLSNSMDCTEGRVIKEYGSLKELVWDGWTLD